MESLNEKLRPVEDDVKLAHQGTYESLAITKGFGVDELNGSKVLEAGCGSGKLGIYVAKQGAHVHLLDIDSRMIDRARSIRNTLSINYQGTDIGLMIDLVKGNILQLPYPDNSFDLVFNEGVNEHFFGKQRLKVFEEMVRVTKNMVICIVPNADSKIQEQRSNETQHIYKGMPEKEKPFTNKELKNYLHEAGLRDVKVLELMDSSNEPVRLAGKGVKK